MEQLLSPTAWLVAFGIFLARAVNIAIDTVRFMPVSYTHLVVVDR